MNKNTVITAKMLRAKNACENQVAIFEREWPKGARPTLKNIRRATELGLDVDWFARTFLDAPAWAAYKDARAAAWAAYKDARAAARVPYKEAKAPARVAYEEARAAALVAAIAEAKGD